MSAGIEPAAGKLEMGATRPIAPDNLTIHELLPAVAPTFLVIAAAATVITPHHRLGLVDRQRAAVEICTVERCNGVLRLAARAHFNEAEAARLAGNLSAIT